MSRRNFRNIRSARQAVNVSNTMFAIRTYGDWRGGSLSRVTHDKEYVAGLEKGLAILEAFGIHRGPLTLTEAATITGHTRASARRSLLTLEKLGYVTSDGRFFQLAPRTLRLAHAYVVANPLGRVVQPVLEAISERTRESSSLAVRDGMESVFVARAATRRSLSHGLVMGSRLPAWCSATGRVLLAEESDENLNRALRSLPLRPLTPHTETDVDRLLRNIAEARERGFAVCNEELELGFRSIAVPVRDRDGRVVAAMSLVAAASRMSVDELVDTLLPALERGRRLLDDSL